jgi:uncharacterized membrane protein YfcA
VILVALIVLVAALVQGVMGFGGALIAMPLLAALLGIKTAAPAFALIGVAATFFNSVRLRRHATGKDLIQLALPAVLGIPLGVWLLARVDEAIVTRVLGVVLVAYAVYALLGWAVPPLRHRAWAFVVGFTSGILTGAYNTGGPPVVVYGVAREWPADRFRANLQTFFLLSSAFVVALHGLAGHLTAPVWQCALISLPTLLVGQLIGARLCRYLNPAVFRKIVLLFLGLVGASLLF